MTVPGCRVCERPAHGRKTVRTGRLFAHPGAEEPESEEVCDGVLLSLRGYWDGGDPGPIEPPELADD